MVGVCGHRARGARAATQGPRHPALEGCFCSAYLSSESLQEGLHPQPLPAGSAASSLSCAGDVSLPQHTGTQVCKATHARTLMHFLLISLWPCSAPGLSLTPGELGCTSEVCLHVPPSSGSPSGRVRGYSVTLPEAEVGVVLLTLRLLFSVLCFRLSGGASGTLGGGAPRPPPYFRGCVLFLRLGPWGFLWMPFGIFLSFQYYKQ